MFHSVGRILRWAKGYRKRMILGFVCSFFATWCTAGPVMLAAWALGQMIVNAWGENGLPASLPMAVLRRHCGADFAAVLLHLLEKPTSGEHRNGTGGRAAHGTRDLV